VEEELIVHISEAQAHILSRYALAFAVIVA
jgi:hypothetical protein